MAAAPPTAVDDGWKLPTDAFVEILLRLTPICRRRVRLVCRHWRDVIDERTPQSPPPMVLAFFSSRTWASAMVIDDLSGERGTREVWWVSIDPGTKRYIDVNMVGTCNGLLCLCDNTKPGGAVALVNPATGEKLRIPPLPVSYRQRKGYRSWETYSFAFDPTTGLYKILHLPCREDMTGGFNVLQVLTLGDASWSDVPIPGGSCCLSASLVSVGGATYWVTNGLEKVVCFDLKDERVAFDAPLPVGPGRGYEFRLTEVHGRLGLAVRADMRTPVTTEEVWVLDDRQGWTRRYRVRAHGVDQRLAAPYFAAHGGEYVLAEAKERGRKQLHAHRLPEAGIWLPRGDVRSVRISEPGTVVAYCTSDCYNLRTFAYVETTEPLSIYKIDDGRVQKGSSSK